MNRKLSISEKLIWSCLSSISYRYTRKTKTIFHNMQ